MAPLGLMSASQAAAPEVTHQGLNVSMAWRHGGWHVAVPAENWNKRWVPGQAVAIEWVTLAEFLSALEADCGLSA